MAPKDVLLDIKGFESYKGKVQSVKRMFQTGSGILQGLCGGLQSYNGVLQPSCIGKQCFLYFNAVSK